MIGWVDVETTGLDPRRGNLLEVGIILTNDDLNEIARRAVVLKPPPGWRQTLDPFILDMHTKSGVLDEGERTGLDVLSAQSFLTRWLTNTVGRADGTETWPSIPMAGNTVSFDRGWLHYHMPLLHDLFHYRNIDVSTLKEVNRRIGFAPYWENDGKLHRVLPDLEDSIAEYRSYVGEIEAAVKSRPWVEGQS